MPRKGRPREPYTRAERAWLSQFEPSTRSAWLMRLRTEPDMTQDVALCLRSSVR